MSIAYSILILSGVAILLDEVARLRAVIRSNGEVR